MQTQQEIFQERLARLREKGHRTAEAATAAPLPQPLPQSDAAEAGRSRKGRRAAPGGSGVLGNALYPLSLAGAFLLGFVAVLVGRYVRFHVVAAPAEGHGSDLDLLVTGGIALAASFVLAQVFRLSSKEHAGLQATGVVVALAVFHNLFHWLPGPMAAVFSPDYTAQMQAVAPANTAVFRGMVLAFAEPSAAGGAEAAPGAVAAAAAPSGLPDIVAGEGDVGDAAILKALGLQVGPSASAGAGATGD